MKTQTRRHGQETGLSKAGGKRHGQETGLSKAGGKRHGQETGLSKGVVWRCQCVASGACSSD